MSDSDKREMIQAVEEGKAKFQYVQSRWKSWAMWVSVAGAVWTILSCLGLTEKIGISEGTFKTILDSVGVILIAFGIMNDPTNPYEF